MPPDMSLWQAAGDANNGINSIQARTNKRFRGWDSLEDGEDREVSNQDNRRGRGTQKIKKRGRKRICCHFSSILWRQTHGCVGARQIRHHWTAGMRPEKRKEQRVGQQTARQINHPSPGGHIQCGRTQVAERLPGSAHTARLPRKVAVSELFSRESLAEAQQVQLESVAVPVPLAPRQPRQAQPDQRGAFNFNHRSEKVHCLCN